MNIHVKETKRMPDHISRQPWYEKARATAVRNKESGKLKFESPGAEKDYWRRVNANPMNMPFCPEFFPPREIKSYLSYLEQTEEDERKAIAQRIKEREFISLDLACFDCNPISHRWGGQGTRVTAHSMDTTSCVCTLCGKDNPHFRTHFTEFPGDATSTDTTPASNPQNQ